MHAQILKYLTDIRGSYWFIPSVMALSAIAMSFIMTTVDSRFGAEWIQKISWLYANQPAGARAVLSTIAGSMITVAGVTFSMTIVAVSFATGQLGPRLISNFMRDRSNQVTLGTFIGTFIYCLLVLRTVRDSNGVTDNSAEAISAFVPHVAILFGLASALFSVAMLIYYIHHIPESINVSNLTAKIGQEMHLMVDELFPQQIGFAAKKGSDKLANLEIPKNFYTSAVALESDFDGYIQVMDEDILLKIAIENDLMVRVEYRPGDFVTKGKTLLLVWPAENTNDEIMSQCQNVYARGIERTPTQNILFLIDQLVEIAVRALSPGVNDPFTANSCIDWLQAVLNKMINRDSPNPHRTDEDGNLRVIAHPVRFEDVLNRVMHQIRPYASADRIVVLHLMKMLAELMIELPRDSDRLSLLTKHLTLLKEAALENLDLTVDKNAAIHQYDQIILLLQDPAYRDRLRDDTSWLEGSA